jgi:hypothetical protein
MIPLDRVRAMLAAATAEADGRGRPSVAARDELRSVASLLAAQVLTLAAALETAERERDEAREVAVRLGEVCERQARMLARAPSFEDAMALCIHAIVEPATDAPNCAEWRGTMRGRGFVLSLQWADGKSPQALIAEAMAERDTARSAHAELAAAVRAEREAEAAVHVTHNARIDAFDAVTSHDYGAQARLYAAERRHTDACIAADGARTRLDALLAAAPPRSTVPASIVREYLRAEANCAEGDHASGEAMLSLAPPPPCSRSRRRRPAQGPRRSTRGRCGR